MINKLSDYFLTILNKPLVKITVIVHAQMTNKNNKTELCNTSDPIIEVYNEIMVFMQILLWGLFHHWFITSLGVKYEW